MTGPNHDLIPTPQAAEAEKAVLGTALLDASSLDAVRGTLKPFHFFSIERAQAYEAMLELQDHGQPIDGPLLSAKLREKLGLAEEEAFLRTAVLMDGAYRVANVEAYARQIINAERRRSILRSLPEIERLIAEGKSLEDVGTRLRIEADSLFTGPRRKLVSLERMNS